MDHRSLVIFGAVGAVLTASTAAAAPQVCIRGLQIQDTERPNDHTILFHMKTGETYVNHTVGQCAGLASDPEGFTFSPTDPGSDEYCSNLVTIRLNTSKNECLLGAFTKLAKAPHSGG